MRSGPNALECLGRAVKTEADRFAANVLPIIRHAHEAGAIMHPLFI
jgi:hypothetical protein